MRRMMNRTLIWVLTAMGGGAIFVLEGCDPTVRDTVLTGVEGATGTLLSTFLTAFFQTLQQTEDAGVGTVRAIFENAPDLFT